MKIGLTDTFIKWAQKPRVQKYCDWASQPHIVKKIDNHIPTIESAYITGLYLVDIYGSKDLPEPRKNPLAFNSVICFIGGAIGGIGINKLIKPIQNRVTDNLEKTNIPKKAHVIAGIKTLVPLLSISFMVRYALPVIATPLSVSTNKLFKKLGLAKLDSEDKTDHIRNNKK